MGNNMTSNIGNMKMKNVKKNARIDPTNKKNSWYLVPVDVGTKVRVNMKFASQQIQEVRDAFAIYDKNSTGTIPTKSFICVMRSLGYNLTESETFDMICEIDFNQSGVIHFMEFVEMWAKISSALDETIKEAFNFFDKNGSGSISIEEFRQVMVTEGAQMTDKEIEEILNEADKDGDGEIDIVEFVAMLLHSGNMASTLSS